MAKLSELIDAVNKLSSLDHRLINSKTNDIIQNIMDISTDIKFWSPDLDDLIALESKKQTLLNDIISDLINRCSKDIENWQNTSVIHSATRSSQVAKLDYENWETWKEQFYPPNDELEAYTNNRTNMHSDWRSPSMLWHMDDVKRTNSLLMFYPIYVIDKYRESHKKILQEHSEQQSRKIRFYDLDHLSEVPKKSMKLILSVNHFTHISQEYMFMELSKLSEYLVNGGTIAFNFNDCDISECAAAFESGMRSYMRGTDLKKFVNQSNLIMSHCQYLPLAKTVWVELKKPGRFTSIKKAESLGLIRMRPDFKEKYDTLRQTMWDKTEEEIVDLVRKELNMNIDNYKE